MKVNPLIKTYPDIGAHAFGHKGRAIVSLFLYVELYLVAVEFLILQGDSLDKMFPNMDFKVSGLKIRGKQVFVLLASLAVLPTTWLNNLGVLSYLSAGGVLVLFVLVFSIFWVGALDGVGFHERGEFLNWKGLPTATSMIAFSYCAHACFPQYCVEDKRQFPKVLLVNLRFVTSTFNYGSMHGCSRLPEQHLKSQMTLNLPIEKVAQHSDQNSIGDQHDNCCPNHPIFRLCNGIYGIVLEYHFVYVAAMSVLP
ncbi:hypothetical protein PTKIN_Ptkin03bG0241300 [Pterospermum kingtungense]